MQRAIAGIILTVWASVTLGCATVGSGVGRGSDADAARLDRTLAVSGPLLSRCGQRSLTLHVIGSDVPAAYSWPDGRVAVTSGLVDMLDDAELAAAVAHELGHLLNDGHLRGVAALKGSDANHDEEAAADDTGVRLLSSCGVPPAAMGRMLSRVKDSPQTPDDCRAALAGRVRRVPGP